MFACSRSHAHIALVMKLTDFILFSVLSTGLVPDSSSISDTQESAAGASHLNNIRLNFLLRDEIRRQTVCGRARGRASVYIATAFAH